jgi:serine/threonine-protein kinase
MDGDSSLTITGARVGTPSYMAPEQLTGSSSSLGPAVDIFALGAILYEMLTGRPPFRGDSLSETERRLATEEPAPPSQFNARVPRDLETICLKCLEKDPRSRYTSAADLAADLERFLRHEPILARPIPAAERWMRWIRRNPLLTALAVTSMVLVGLMVSEALQERSDAAALRAEKARLTSRFQSGVQLVQEGRFAEARAILGKLGDGGFENLRQRIDHVLSDLNLVEELEAIGVKRAMALDADSPVWAPDAQAAKEYEALFARTGLGTMANDPASIAQRIDKSDIKDPLIAALDDWAVCESDAVRRHWVLEVARRADAGASDWEIQCRDPAEWADRKGLTRLAETAPTAKPSVQQLRALGDRLAAAGLDDDAFRSRVQQEHVDSFLANLSLADALRATDPAEAIRYYQAALAIHPQSATAHNNLAVALVHLGRSDEAIVEYEQSLKFDPNSAATHFKLSLALAQDHPNEATQHRQRALELNASLATIHRTLEKSH